MVAAKLPGNIVATAVAIEKTDGLDDGHQGKDNADSTRGAVAVQHSHKIGIGHIVK